MMTEYGFEGKKLSKEDVLAIMQKEEYTEFRSLSIHVSLIDETDCDQLFMVYVSWDDSKAVEINKLSNDIQEKEITIEYAGNISETDLDPIRQIILQKKKLFCPKCNTDTVQGYYKGYNACLDCKEKIIVANQ